MRFAFDSDQRAFQAGLRDLLARECPPEAVRAAADTGLSRQRWKALADLGSVGCLVPAEHGGLGLDERSMVLLLEEAGRAALPEPLLETAAVAAPLLREVGGPFADDWLPRIAAGEAIVAVALQGQPYVAAAAAADLLLGVDGSDVHALTPDQIELTAQPTLDPARPLATVRWRSAPKSTVATGASRALEAAADREALGAAALLLGIGRRVIELGTDYALTREQFGVPIGTFQAIKHHLASALVRVELAAPLVYRAAWSTATAQPSRAGDVALARLSAGEAADLACRTALQVHGAIGYTAEHDLHLWLTKAWALRYSGATSTQRVPV